MIYLVSLFMWFAIQTHAAVRPPDPQGLLKAKLFSFEPRVEQITGMPSCEDELSRMIDGLGARIAANSSDKYLGAVGEEAYNEGIREYRRERLNSVGLSFDERVRELRMMIPPREPYRPAKVETNESRAVDYVAYLIDEFSKLEKSAIVHRGIRDLEYAMLASRETKPLETYYLAGGKGRAFRLILFFRDVLPSMDMEYEEGFKFFAAAFLTSEMIRDSLGAHQYDNTRDLFMWLKDHNPVLYFFFLEKYQAFVSEELLVERTK